MTSTPAPTGLRTAKDVLRYARWRHWRHLVAASGLTIANQAGEVMVPVVIGLLVDRAILPGDRVAFSCWLVVLVAVYLAQSLGDRFGTRRTHHGAVLVESDLRLAVLRRIAAPEGGAEKGRLPGDLTAVATTDVWRIAFVNFLIPLAVAGVVGVAVGGTVLLTSSVPVGVTALLIAPIVLGLVHLLSRPLQARNSAQQEGAAEATGVAVDLVRGLRVIKGIGAENQARSRYQDVSRRSLVPALALARSAAVHQGVAVALNGLYLVVVGTVGLVQASRGALTPGQLVTVIGIAQLLVGPMAMVAELSAASAASRAAANRVAGVLSSSAAVAVGSADQTVPTGGGVLSFESVSVGPLVGLTFDVGPREFVGVATDDAATAATLFRCLSREQDPDDGTISLDHVDLTTVNPDSTRAVILAAGHDGALFDDSLAATLSSLGGDDQSVAAAATAARLDDVVAALPAGSATVLAERGRSLSGGQRQRVALARALAGRPAVLVLHEPTTAVDPVTERGIAEGLRQMRAGMSTVVVTTSPTLLQVADRVLVVIAGRLHAEGSHADLLASSPAYRAMVLT